MGWRRGKRHFHLFPYSPVDRERFLVFLRFSRRHPTRICDRMSLVREDTCAYLATGQTRVACGKLRDCLGCAPGCDFAPGRTDRAGKITGLSIMFAARELSRRSYG
jgi:hypothetical protein